MKIRTSYLRLAAAVAAAAALFLCARARAEIVFTSDEGKQRQLYSVAPGGKPVQLTKKDDKDLLVEYNVFPAISKDRQFLAYTSYRVYTDEGLRLWKQWNGKPLYPNEEFYLYFYSYFPTSTYFTRHKSLNWNVFMKDLKTGKERKLSNFLWDEYEPQFMSRGSDLLYVLTAEKSTFVLRGSKSGKSFKQVTLKGNQAIHPQLSPDGRMLVYQSYQNGNWEIYTMRMADLPSGRIETRLTRTSSVYELFPRWTPDGKSVYFMANSVGRSFYDLYLMDVKTMEKRRVTDHASVGADFIMSPSGDRVAYTAVKKRGRALYVVGTDGKNTKLLSAANEEAYFPAWSPDGKRIAYLSRTTGNKVRLYTVGVDGTGRTKVADTQCSLSPIIWY